MADARPMAGWRSRDVLRAAALVAGLVVALWFLWAVRSVACLAFLGVLFGLALGAGADRLERWRVPRGAGALIIVLLVLGVLTGLGALTAPRIGEQLREVRQRVPEAIDRIESWIERRQAGAVEMLEEPGQRGGRSEAAREAPVKIREGLVQQAAKVGHNFFAVFSSTLTVLAALILVLAVAIYVAVDPGLYHAGLMHLFPHRSRKRAGEVLSAVATTLRDLTDCIAQLGISGPAIIFAGLDWTDAGLVRPEHVSIYRRPAGHRANAARDAVEIAAEALL